MSPFEIARETLRRLAQQRIAPTPDNYLSLYHEIAGTTPAEAFPARALRALAAALPRQSPEQVRFVRQLDTAIAKSDWQGVEQTLARLMQQAAGTPPDWSSLLRTLLARLEMRQADLTPARKREALEHVLASSATPQRLYERLQSLIDSWSLGALSESEVLAPADAVPPAPTLPSGAEAAPDGRLLDLLAQLLDTAISVFLGEQTGLGGEARRLASDARAVRAGTGDAAAFLAAMKRFGYRLTFAAEDDAELRGALLHLLQLIISNINELVIEDHWLQGQVAVLRDLVAQPLNLRRLDDVERHLKDVIYKQINLKKSLNAAQEELKAMLASFVDRLADFASTTGSYHDKIEHCATKISQASDITELTTVLDEVMRETRAVQVSTQRSHDELQQMRKKVDSAEHEVARLQQALASASELMRHDALTGALNRKGLDEALGTEISRARRHGGQLCLALLDIDDFKKLNDSLGHAVGDAALVHLTRVVAETIRPEDTLARYGGEEFVVLLPNTALEDAITAMARVQRELTRRFFLHNNDRVLITFSCGIAEIGTDETAEDVIQRADNAMYLAKRAGKNRVMAG